jgi:AmmeMemoRadiSam system protein A
MLPDVTNDADRTRLLQIARHAITAHATGSPRPAVDAAWLPSRRGGAFVTLHKAGELRGCIGHLEANDLLTKVVARCAVAASSADPRFPAIEHAELSLIEIEISLLGMFERIGGPAEVEIGRHGLLVENGRQRGLLLPQVAVEWNWNAATFLNQTCRKAGLPAEGWRSGAVAWRFEAEVFSEPQGPSRSSTTRPS